MQQVTEDVSIIESARSDIENNSGTIAIKPLYTVIAVIWIMPSKNHVNCMTQTLGIQLLHIKDTCCHPHVSGKWGYWFSIPRILEVYPVQRREYSQRLFLNLEFWPCFGFVTFCFFFLSIFWVGMPVLCLPHYCILDISWMLASLTYSWEVICHWINNTLSLMFDLEEFVLSVNSRIC